MPPDESDADEVIVYNALFKSIYQISSNFVRNKYFRHDGQFSAFRRFFVKNEILWSLYLCIMCEQDTVFFVVYLHWIL